MLVLVHSMSKPQAQIIPSIFFLFPIDGGNILSQKLGHYCDKPEHVFCFVFTLFHLMYMGVFGALGSRVLKAKFKALIW